MDERPDAASDPFCAAAFDFANITDAAACAALLGPAISRDEAAGSAATLAARLRNRSAL